MSSKLFISTCSTSPFMSGEKEGRVGVAGFNDWTFTIPTIEYRNMTWTYLDLVKAIRKDCIKSVLTQIPRQLIGNTTILNRSCLLCLLVLVF